MKKLLIPCLQLLLSLLLVQTGAAATGSSIETSVRASWQLDAKPLDLVHTLDNKRVYILGDDSKVHIYSAGGAKQGTIPVAEGVTAIDIAPRGEMLYLIDSEKNTFTSLTVSFTAKINITGSPFVGEENAPVTMVVFSDFQ